MDFQDFSRKLQQYRTDSVEARDAQLESDCIQLLGRLEAHLRTIRFTKRSRRADAALEVGKEILVDILEFVTERYGDHAVATDLSRICFVRDLIRDLKTIMSRGVWAHLLRGNSTHFDLKKQAFEKVGIEFTEIFRELLSVVDGHFYAENKVREWRSGCRILIDEFRQQWRSCGALHGKPAG